MLDVQTMCYLVLIVLVLSAAPTEGQQKSYPDLRRGPHVTVITQYDAESADNRGTFSNPRSLLTPAGNVEQMPKQAKLLSGESSFVGATPRRQRKFFTGESYFSDKSQYTPREVLSGKNQTGGNSDRERKFRKPKSGESNFSGFHQKIVEGESLFKDQVSDNSSPKDSGVIYISGGSHVRGKSENGKAESPETANEGSGVTKLFEKLQKFMGWGWERPQGRISKYVRSGDNTESKTKSQESITGLFGGSEKFRNGFDPRKYTAWNNQNPWYNGGGTIPIANGRSPLTKTKVKIPSGENNFRVGGFQKFMGWESPRVGNPKNLSWGFEIRKPEMWNNPMQRYIGGGVYIPHQRRNSRPRIIQGNSRNRNDQKFVEGESEFEDNVHDLPTGVIEGESLFSKGPAILGSQTIRDHFTENSGLLRETVRGGYTADDHVTVKHCKTTTIDINPLLNYIDHKFEEMQNRFLIPLEMIFNKVEGIMEKRITQLGDDLLRSISVEMEAKLTNNKTTEKLRSCQRSFRRVSNPLDVVSKLPSNKKPKLENEEQIVDQFERCKNVRNECSQEVMMNIFAALKTLNRKVDSLQYNDSLILGAIRDLQPTIGRSNINMIELRNVLDEYHHAVLGSINNENGKFLTAAKSAIDQAGRRFHANMMGALTNVRCPLAPEYLPANPPVGDKVYRVIQPPIVMNRRLSGGGRGWTAPWW